MQETYQTEPELLGPLPRTVVWRYTRIRRGMIGFAVFEAALLLWALYASFKAMTGNIIAQTFMPVPWGIACCMLPAFFAFLLRSIKEKRLIAEGMPVGAVIIDKKFRSWSDRDGRHQSCTLYYEFRVPGRHEPVRGKMLAANAFDGDAAELDDLLTVLYLPDNARKNMLYPHSFYMAAGGQSMPMDIGY